ncbi:MAG: four helix bundle suffix domain-containing protein [Candidatus Binatia bacterium]
MTYKPYIENSEEIAANTLICLINQTNYLLDQQLRQLEEQFLDQGGFTERLYRTRVQARKSRGGQQKQDEGTQAFSNRDKPRPKVGAGNVL